MTVGGEDIERSMPGIVRATPRGRLLAAGLLAIAIALLVFFQLVVLPFIEAGLSSNPSPQLIATLKYIFVAFSALAILPAIALIVTGRKILKCGQSPAPDAWVWRDTKIKQGKEAIRIAWICIASGALACLLCVLFVAYIWLLFDQLVPQHKLRPGVTILQQQVASKL